MLPIITAYICLRATIDIIRLALELRRSQGSTSIVVQRTTETTRNDRGQTQHITITRTISRRSAGRRTNLRRRAAEFRRRLQTPVHLTDLTNQNEFRRNNSAGNQNLVRIAIPAPNNNGRNVRNLDNTIDINTSANSTGHLTTSTPSSTKQ